MRKLTTLSFFVGICLLFSCAKEEMNNLMPVAESSINQELEADQLQNSEFGAENAKRSGDEPHAFSVAGSVSSPVTVIPNTGAPVATPIGTMPDPAAPVEPDRDSSAVDPNTLDHHYLNPADFNPFPSNPSTTGHP